MICDEMLQLWHVGGHAAEPGIRAGHGGEGLGVRVQVHMNDPMAIAKLQQATKDNSRELYKEFSAANTALSRRVHLRGLLKFRDDQTAIPLDEVESAATIVRRFCTGAMSYGSISLEAHTSLAKVRGCPQTQHVCLCFRLNGHA